METYRGPEELAAGEADVWVADLRKLTRPANAAESLLSQAERERTARFHRRSDATRYLKTHTLLALLLKAYRVQPLHWSSASRGRFAVFGFSAGDAIGVDIELIEPRTAATLAARCLDSHELSALSRLRAPARTRRIFELWTAKEAVLKRSGHGLSVDPRLLCLDFAEPRRPVVASLPDRQAAIGNCAIEMLALAEGYVGAVAVSRVCRALRVAPLDEVAVRRLLAREIPPTEA